jgi:hypothetical protein
MTREDQALLIKTFGNSISKDFLEDYDTLSPVEGVTLRNYEETAGFFEIEIADDKAVRVKTAKDLVKVYQGGKVRSQTFLWNRGKMGFIDTKGNYEYHSAMDYGFIPN